MFASALLFLVIVFLLVFALLASFFSLSAGLRWAGARDWNRRKVVRVIAIMFVLQIALRTLINLIPPSSTEIPSFILDIAAFVFLVGVLKASFQLTVLQTLKAMVANAFLGTVPTLLAALLVKSFVFEVFLVPTNSMAPTLRGLHWQGVCPTCGSVGIVAPIPKNGYRDVQADMICEKHFHITSNGQYSESNINGDRFVSCKLFSPQRWDLVTFRLPSEPQILYVKRLIGLPGEEIIIRDGAIWANGRQLTPPDHLLELKYDSVIEGFQGVVWGSEEHPAKLGRDEYFFLGDFTTRAADSRLWTAGADGHPPYAVPKENLHGVVTHRVWPAARWKNF